MNNYNYYIPELPNTSQTSEYLPNFQIHPKLLNIFPNFLIYLEVWEIFQISPDYIFQNIFGSSEILGSAGVIRKFGRYLKSFSTCPGAIRSTER